MTKPKTLRFGIKSLDKLIGSVSDGEVTRYGVDLSQPDQSPEDSELAQQVSASLCLAGPDGTGKSIFSLHLASHYLADCLSPDTGEVKGDLPKVLYISTDLTYTVALRGWNNFDLMHPFERREPLLELNEGRKQRRGRQILVGLRQYFPSEDNASDRSVMDYLEKPSLERSHKTRSNLTGKVCFVDLATRTAGDDWGFVHRLLSMLDEPGSDSPRHLVILDAVEGFETLVGDLNAFGESSSRRSRIAQVMRLAAGKAHLLLVVEEKREERFPEEFVTDVVVRLRNVETGRYLRRTIEIEKARGQLHTRGQHPFVIRDGKGSTTGNQDNFDDPEVPNGQGHQAYAHVFLSNNYTNREIMNEKYNPRAIPEGDRFAAFGVPYLDNMLGGNGERAERQKDTEGDYDTRGLPCGSATALLGDSLTQNGQLGKAFLSRAFYPFAEDLAEQLAKYTRSDAARRLERTLEKGIRDVAHNKSSAREVIAGLIQGVKSHLPAILARMRKKASYREPVTVMFTTQDVNHDNLADQFYEWLKDEDGIARKDDRASGMGGLTGAQNTRASAGFQEQMEAMIITFAKKFSKYERKPNRNYESFRKKRSYPEARDRFIDLLVKQTLEREIKSHIRSLTICRRFEIHDIPSAILMHIFQRNIEKGQRLMLGLKESSALPYPADRFKSSWRIRVVIDDLNSFRNIFPEIREDTLMLPSLLFMLGREGVTSLIIDTQSSGSPDLPITERFDSSVRELVQTRIYTWRLPFYGENRVAISLIPPISHEYRGVIRELRWETKYQRKTDRALTVDPHFELYMGLERGQPQPVPLEVQLYAETPSFKRYIDGEEKLFGEVFMPVTLPSRKNGGRIINHIETADYDTLRDSCHLHRDTQTDHTTVMQVDEFWWLRRPRQRLSGAFRPQWNYLSAVTASKDDAGDFKSEAVADPFGVFQPSAAQKTAGNSKNAKTAGKQQKVAPKELRRLDFFDNRCGYKLIEMNEGTSPGEKQYIDRVPFAWDFGFMLCNGYAWNEAAEQYESGEQIKQVWNDLRKANESGQTEAVPVEWRRFLEASKFVAEFQSYKTSTAATAFDFTMLIPESFSCLILEMWASEVYSSLKRYGETSEGKAQREFEGRRHRIVDRLGTKSWSTAKTETRTLLDALKEERGRSLGTILKLRKTTQTIDGYSLELYKVWLLLIEAINFSELVDSSSHLNFQFKSRNVSPQAISARHWYKTASNFIDSITPEQLEYDWTPTRLPGHFSVRADWFLAVAGGSRSSRLGDHALDLLSSQRANITRLQEGIGLPTRKLFDVNHPDRNWESSHLRTRLISVPEKGKPLANVEYEELRKIGASQNAADEEFYWLWRSGIAGYNRHSRIWHKWLKRTLLWWNSWHQRYGSSWTRGFKVYDDLHEIEFGELDLQEMEKKQLDSWTQFGDLRDILVAELEQVSVSTI
jgi:KaiC/GvpD/RAD55 family RecA-like ATPase